MFKKIKANIGVQDNLLMYLIILNVEAFKRSLMEQCSRVRTMDMR